VLLQGGDVTVKISSDRCSDKYFKMDTIAKAENILYGFGTIFSFSNMTKDFNPLCLWKSAVRGFEYFSKLLYVAAVNKKSSSFKSH
jgi:hypothetical protein